MQAEIETFSILFVDNGTATSYLKVQQMALVNKVGSIPPSNFLSKSVSSAICRISFETRTTKSIRKFDQQYSSYLCSLPFLYSKQRIYCLFLWSE